ncbi:hypothetical protein [Streptomyces sp. N35]|uniref:hypothetical protein n=1 Tax=Streptomyces sp. N35 TaxID=2795730 RepID=UPI0018F4CBD3|nr:hypothetical protein [Streptomyces sp. N35]
MGWEIRSSMQERFGFINGWVGSNAPCVQIRGGATGKVSVNRSCKFYEAMLSTAPATESRIWGPSPVIVLALAGVMCSGWLPLVGLFITSLALVLAWRGRWLHRTVALSVTGLVTAVSLYALIMQPVTVDLTPISDGPAPQHSAPAIAD